MSLLSPRGTAKENRVSARRSHYGAVICVLALGDLTGLVLAAAMAYALRVVFIGPLSLSGYQWLMPAFVLFLLTYAYLGLYPGYGIGPAEQLARISQGSSLVSLLIIASTYLTRHSDAISRFIILLWWFLALVAVPVIRAATRTILIRTPWWGEPVLIFGAARTGELVAKRLLGSPEVGLRPVGFLDDDLGKQGRSVAGVPVVGPLSHAAVLAQLEGIRMAVIAMPGQGRSQVTRIIEEHAASLPQVIVIPDLLGITSLWVSTRDLQGVLGLEVRQNLLIRWNIVLKRMMDLVLTIPALVLAGPLVLISAVAVKLYSPGPAFFSQERGGVRGKPIRVWKIRTMVPNAEKVLYAHLEADPAAKQEWEQFMKLRRDPRIVPRVGHLLRRFSIDELPQLWNVLRGDLSLVGPRPFPDYHLKRFSPRFQALRSRVKPGITGIWQVTARSDARLELQEELDTYYIRNWSIWLDVYVLARTVSAVLFGKGAY